MLKSYVSLQSYLTRLLNRDDRGATAVEYGLIVALIAVIIIPAVTLLGTNLLGAFNAVAGAI
jgi:pilus assembly protein Flp/PilA